MENFTCFTFAWNRKMRKKKSKRSGSQLERCSNIFFTRCGLSSTYHLVPLALLQYDTKPTRQCDSIMLIHDSLDTGVFQYHPSTISQIYRASRLLRARCCLLLAGIIGSSSPFPIICVVNYMFQKI